MFYLTSIIFFEQKYLTLETSSSTNLNQPTWPPQNTQNNKKVFFSLFVKQTHHTWNNPSKMSRLTKRAISIRECEALAEHQVRKAFIRLCFDKEDSSEDDIDNRILAELAALRASRYCLRVSYRQWDINWKECWRMVRTCPMMSFCLTFTWIDHASCNWTIWSKMNLSSDDSSLEERPQQQSEWGKAIL